MTRVLTRALIGVAITSLGSSADAQSTIPIRKLGPAEAVAAESITVSAGVRPLSSGGVMVANRRRVLLFDANLKFVRVAADSTSLTPGRRAMIAQFPLIGFPGDTTLTVDRNASSLLVIDPAGKIVRAIAFPTAADAEEIAGQAGSSSGYADPKGRLIYKGKYPRAPNPSTTTSVAAASADSFPIVRADLDRRTVDTLGMVRTPRGTESSLSIERNPMVITTTYKPFSIVDTWTALPDGSVAIVRGSDYHVDWINADGTKLSTPKMPFDWRRITDEEKARVIDSINAYEGARARTDSIERAQGRRSANTLVEKWAVVPPSQIPDYFPPIRDSGIRADGDGNVWILPTTSLNARDGLLYDVVNRRGVVFERVQLPPTCALGAPGSRGAVFLICDGHRLEKRHIQR